MVFYLLNDTGHVAKVGEIAPVQNFASGRGSFARNNGRAGRPAQAEIDIMDEMISIEPVRIANKSSAAG